MSQSTLKEFPKIATPGTITVAELAAQLIAVPSDPDNPVDEERFCERLSSYKKINGMLKPTFEHKIPPVRVMELRDANSLMLRHDEGIIKGMWDACRESGWRGLAQYLRQVEKNPVASVLVACLTSLASVTDAIFKLKQDTVVLFFPHLGLSSEMLIRDSASVRNWSKSWLKAVAWHPNFSMLAFALKDDSIRICEVGDESIPLLRCTEQQNISCVAWRPYTRLQLSVGVESGIIVWDLETSNNIKPGASLSHLLSVPNHAPVTSVEYSSNGIYLLSSSSRDTSIYVWDVSSWTKTALRRVEGGGVPIASWSPPDDRIVATSPGTVFRIWERENSWIPKRWYTPNGTIESVCWMPDGRSLLFACAGTLYAVHFVVNAIEKFISQNNSVCTPLYDVSECTVLSEDEKLEYKVGGRVRNMDIDPSGNRLTVCFDDSELVAVFRVQPKSLYFLAPSGFIRGYPNEYPLTLAFQRNFTDGALLTIAWNSGRVQYFPFLFAGTDSHKNLLHQEYYKSPLGLQMTAKPKANPNSRKSTPSNLGASFLQHDDSSEDVIVLSNRAARRSYSFVDAPSTPEYEFVTEPEHSLRLFSLDENLSM